MKKTGFGRFFYLGMADRAFFWYKGVGVICLIAEYMTPTFYEMYQ
jgi:hypothetical protein